MSTQQSAETTEQLRKQMTCILESGPMIPGRIKKQWNVCGMPKCRCKDPDNPQKHGPYHQLSFTLAGKSTTMFVKDDEFDSMSAATDRYHEFKSLSLKLVQAYVEEERDARKKRSKSRRRRP